MNDTVNDTVNDALTRRGLLGLGALAAATVAGCAGQAGPDAGTTPAPPGSTRPASSPTASSPAASSPAASSPAGRGLLVPPLLRADRFTVAHRGGAVDQPEMSMAAYRSSVALGVDALEISLARTSDGVWFGLHDPTLDRTSGTHLVAAAGSTWAQVSALCIRPSGRRAAQQQPQPYLRLEDLAAAYGGTHAIFVDPKAADASHLGELLTVMDRAVPDPTSTFVAKAYGPSTAWGRLARSRGYRTWGYYYGRQIADGATPLAATQATWDLLGLDVDAPDDVWRQVLGLGRPVVAHVVFNPGQARRALASGAHGLMVAAVAQVLRGL